MSGGPNIRSRGFGSLGAGFTPSLILEYSTLIDDGAVFAWDASGPQAMMQQAALAAAPPEFAYLALDTQPIQLFIKRSAPGVMPVVWNAGPSAVDITRADLFAAQAQMAQSVASAAASAAAAAAAVQTVQLLIFGFVNGRFQGQSAQALNATLAAALAQLPQAPPAGVNQMWLNQGMPTLTQN